MKVLVVYDSVYKNTEIIAQAISSVLPAAAVKVIKADTVTQADLDGINLLVAGSPTQGGRAVANLQKFLTEIPSNRLKGIKVAAFDTRMTGENHGFALRLLVKTIGYAAGRIAQSLLSKGGELILPPEGFIVNDREGPLKDGELERAAAWGKMLLLKIS